MGYTHIRDFVGKKEWHAAGLPLVKEQPDLEKTEEMPPSHVRSISLPDTNG